MSSSERTYVLPARVEGPALATMKSELMALRGADLCLDGQAVERINGLGLELLMASIATWQADRHGVRIAQPSQTLTDALAHLQTWPGLADVARDLPTQDFNPAVCFGGPISVTGDTVA